MTTPLPTSAMHQMAKQIAGASPGTPVKDPSPLRVTKGVVLSGNPDGTLVVAIDGGDDSLVADVLWPGNWAAGSVVEVLVAQPRVIVLPPLALTIGAQLPRVRAGPASQLVLTTGATGQMLMVPVLAEGGATVVANSIVVPVTGPYVVSWSVLSEVSAGGISSAGDMVSQVRRNGAVERSATVYGPVSGQPQPNGCDVIDCNAGDQLALWVTNTSSTSVGYGLSTATDWLSATLMR